MDKKRTVNIGKNKGKMGRPPPDWLYELADGIYTVNDLMGYSKKSDGNVKGLMAKYAKEVTYVVQENARSSARYHWNQKHFLNLTNQKLPEIDINNVVVTDKLMDPKIDFTFKELFGHNPTNFIHLANAILNLNGDRKIQSVTFLNLEMSKDNEDDRGSRLDVLAELHDKSFINIEMQCADYKDFEKRSMYYFSKIYGGQLKKKEDFCDLKPVVIINLLDFVIFDDEEDFHSPLIISNAKTHKRRCKDFEMHFIEIPKLNKTCYDATNLLEKWVLFFKEPQKETLKELSMHSQEIAQAFESLEILSKNTKKRAEYEARKKALLDIRNGMRVNRDEGIAEGETRKAIAMARNLKALGVPMDTIMKASGLTLEQVKQA